MKELICYTERFLLQKIFTLPAETILKTFKQKAVILDEQRLHPEMQLYLLIRKIRKSPGMGDQPPVQSRQTYVRDSLVHGIRIDNIKMEEFNLDGVRARFYKKSDDLSPVIIYYHGGGFVIGDLEMFDHVCRYLCDVTGYKIFAVDYRKAPEFPFPTGIEDGIKGYKWAMERAEKLGFNPDKVIIAGDSAGACLATVISQTLAQEGYKLPVKQLLFYPPCDWGQDYQSTELFAENFFLTKRDLIYFGDHYLNGNDQSDPRISPLRGHLKGLPPAIIITAGFDPLRDQGEAYAAKLREAGVVVKHVRKEGMIHGFINLVGFSPYAREVVSEVLSWIRC